MARQRNRQMTFKKLHPWKVTPAEARKIQENLRSRWEGKDRLPQIKTIAGLDAAFVLTGSQALKKKASRWNALREANRAIGGVVVFNFPELIEIDRAHAIVPLQFPYVPGFLSFREIPALLTAFKRLKQVPDLFFCDGQGYAHPRRMGLATHLGILLDRPTIGCAKSILIGTHSKLAARAGNWTPLLDEQSSQETIGAAVRTRDGAKPVYVSQGHRISLPTAIQLTLQVCDGVRIPRPTREADRLVSEVKRKLIRNS